MVPTGQEMVREKDYSRSGKCQGILFWVRKDWHFEEKAGKIDIVRLTIEGRMKHFGSNGCKELL